MQTSSPSDTGFGEGGRGATQRTRPPHHIVRRNRLTKAQWTRDLNRPSDARETSTQLLGIKTGCNPHHFVGLQKDSTSDDPCPGLLGHGPPRRGERSRTQEVSCRQARLASKAGVLQRTAPCLARPAILPQECYAPALSPLRVNCPLRATAARRLKILRDRHCSRRRSVYIRSRRRVLRTRPEKAGHNRKETGRAPQFCSR